MRSLLFVLLWVAACSTSSDEKPPAPPDQPVRPPLYDPPQLDGAGKCVGPVCTLHFALEATGDFETFSVTHCQEPECRSWQGKLTTKAQAKLRELAGRLSKERFKPAYGCAGCADGPTHEVILHHPDGRKLDYTLDPMTPRELPPLLLEASKLIETFSDALYRCEASELFVPAPNCKEIKDIEVKRPSGFP